MRGKLFAVALLLLVWAVPVAAQAPRPLLPTTVTGVTATSNVTVNASLSPAFILSGTISGDSGSTPSSVIAVSTTTGSFQATTRRTRIESRSPLAPIVSMSVSRALAARELLQVLPTPTQPRQPRLPCLLILPAISRSRR
jgi:hypothetical protein